MNKLTRLSFFVLPVLSGCGGIERFLEEPNRPPEAWLEDHHFIDLDSIILSQPSSSVLVFFASFLAIAFGVSLVRDSGGHNSRSLWGQSLIIGGIGAVFAGISYQAFGYEIKCRGYEFCLWTSWWELAYLLSTVLSSALALRAVSHSLLGERGQRHCHKFAVLLVLGYLVVLSLGLVLTIRFLISFEFMILWTAPAGFSLVVIVAKEGGKNSVTETQKAYLWAGLALLAAVIGHGVYGHFSWGEALWEQGIWFTENDLFHVGMIVWLLAIRKVLFPHIRDSSSSASAP